MKEFRGILNQKGLASFNQCLFDNMACFSDVVWVIDLEHEMVEVLFDNIEPETVDHSYSLGSLRERIRSRYPGENKAIVDRYTVEYLSTLKETVYFSNPTFVSKGRRFKLRQAITPEVDENGTTARVYVTAINTQNFMSPGRERTEVYKTVSMILSHAKSLEQGINDTLRHLGETLNASRVYVFENDADSAYCSNTFEWCEEGIEPNIEKMQHISYSESGYDQIFARAQAYSCVNVEEIRDPAMRDQLQGQGIHAFLKYAFYDKDEFAGFVGIDDCRTSRVDWDHDSEEVEVLTFAADLLTTYLIKERNLLKAKRSETEMRDSRAVLETLVKAYSAAYTVNLIEDSYEILHMEPKFAQVFTMNGGRADMERFVENHVHPDDKEKMRQMIRPEYISERLRHENEITFTLRQEYNGVDQTLHALIIKGADEYHAAVGFMDVTDEVQREQEINRQLEAANKAKQDFLSSMSHDIRTPMNAIIGMVDIALKSADNPDKMVTSLYKIRTSGNQLLSLVNDVLDISAIENGKTVLRPVPHNVYEGRKQLQNMALGLLSNKQLTLNIDQHDIICPWIMVDEVRLQQIVNNMLSNAVKYTPEGGSVLMESWQERDEGGNLWEVVAVSDTGIGMTEEFMEHMWETFSRATDTRINKVQGAGLGLTIMKSFVELMGGTITVESELDKGSTFTVRIPIEPTEPEEALEEEGGENAESVSLNVLVAEDNDLNWEIAHDLLEMCGITCTRAVNGKEALDMFEDSEPGTYDAILMDMQMPIMNGVEATKAIRASDHPDAQRIPILAVTANAFAEDIEECKSAGMNEHLAKPIDIEKVLSALKTYTN